MQSHTDYLIRYGIRPFGDYLSTRVPESPTLRRRSPSLLRSAAHRHERRPRPLSTSYLDSDFRKEDSLRLAPSFYSTNRHFSRKELPLCTPDELLDIIREPAGYYALPTDPWNEVYPDIYLSDAPTALCTSILKRMGITHVLNAAQGREKHCGQVNTWAGFYSQTGIQFLGVPAFDNVVFRIHPYFEEAADFIDEALRSGGKVLVHCRAGISRSATLVCAFLMLKRNLTAQEAVKTVRKNRAIIPNDGFLQQLCDLNDKLKRNNKLCS
ncbi:dual specificity protein phosphatase 3-like [Uloborus diversus]|uniref:dual specificity protein phosphatase 3-like n=1 Tax=Uloborus diversus TaxID=327109 RepID=UPI0024099E71|nr:dual specificity protein phosphatase 3-like [Uloborus diversus]